MAKTKLRATLMALCLFSQMMSPIHTKAAELKYTSNLHTQPDTSSTVVTALQTDLTGFKEIAQSETLTLYMNPQSLAIKVLNKASGYLWSSTIDDVSNENLNTTWKNYVESAITITYIDSQNRTSTESITTSDSEISISSIQNGFEAKVKFNESKITVVFQVFIDGDEVIVYVPSAQLADSLKNKLVSVDVYPFLGASKNEEIDGYMFVPDGSGALMRYKDRSKNRATAPYVGNVYGSDLGFTANSTSTGGLNAPEQIYVPVFGVVHGVKQHGLSTFIQSGAEYTQIQAYPAGVTTDYNFIFPRFMYRYQYFQPTSKNMNGINVYQQEMNNFDVTLRYNFYEEQEASYVGFANRYQEFLLEEQQLRENTSSTVDLRIEFLGAEQKKGLLYNTVIPMTTFDEAYEIIQDLFHAEVDFLNVLYRGYTKGGLSGTNPEHFPLEGKLGSTQDFKKLVELLENHNGTFGLYMDLVLADSNVKSYSGAKDLAKAANTATIYETNIDYTNYLLTPQKSFENGIKEMEQLKKLGLYHIGLPKVGTLTFTDSNKYMSLTRTETLEVYQTLLSTYGANDLYMDLYRPIAPNFFFANNIYDLPMHSSQYIYFSDTVPFLQMVLKGYVDYYAPFSNFYADLTDDVLRMIDYGAFPSFYLTAQSTSLLKDTGSAQLYSAEYTLWKDEIIREYEMVQKALDPVQGERIIDREVLEPGVVCVTYSNLVKVYVNYLDRDVRMGDVDIQAKDFQVIW